MALLDGNARELRHSEKRHAVLRFLREELWSTADILGDVMNVHARQAVHRSLQQLERAELLRRHTFSLLGRSITLWGITAHGQACAFDPATEQQANTYFEPSRISELTLMHTLDIQRLHVRGERAGWTRWRNGDRLGSLGQNKRPDAVAVSPEGQMTAIECERTIKTTKRYEVILSQYLQSLRRGEITQVIWACPDTDLALRLRRIITSVRAVPVAGQRMTIDPARHHSALRFVSYVQWPNLPSDTADVERNR